MEENKITKNSKVNRKYTNGGASQVDSGSSCRFQGWSSDGLNRINELFDMVKFDCETKQAVIFENAFREYCVSGGVSGKSAKKVPVVYETVVVRHELWSESE